LPTKYTQIPVRFRGGTIVVADETWKMSVADWGWFQEGMSAVDNLVEASGPK
jgi:hypothetical protein